MVKVADEPSAAVGDFQEAGDFKGGLVDAKRTHDAQAGGTFQRADEPAVSIEEVGPKHHVPHLVEAQEKAAGMWVERADEPGVDAQEAGKQLRPV